MGLLLIITILKSVYLRRESARVHRETSNLRNILDKISRFSWKKYDCTKWKFCGEHELRIFEWKTCPIPIRNVPLLFLSFRISMSKELTFG